MKKIIFPCFVALCSATIFVACRKEVANDRPTEIQNQNNVAPSSDTSLILLSLDTDKNGMSQLNYDSEFGLSEYAGILVFRSSREYWAAVETEDPEKLNRLINKVDNMNYKSFEESIVNDQTKKDTLYTGLMPKLINEKETIIIGKNIYKINMHEEKVYTMPAAYINEVNELYIQNALNKKIKAYSTHGVVIEIVEKGIGCGEGCAPHKNQTKEGRVTTNGREIEFRMKIKYFHYGLGTDLDTKVELLKEIITTYTWNSVTNTWDTNITVNNSPSMSLYGAMFRQYKVKCGGETPMGLLPVQFHYGTHLRIQSYTLRKCLSKYDARSNFQYKYLTTDNWAYFNPEDSNVYPLRIIHGY